MSAIATLKTLLTLDHEAGRFIYTGMAIFAAGAVVIGFKVDPWAAAKVGAVAVGFAFVLSVVLYVSKQPIMKAVLGWMLVTTLGYFLLCVTAALFPRSPIVALVGPQPPFTCYLSILTVPVEVCEMNHAPITATVGGNSASLMLLHGPERLWLAQAELLAEGTTVYFQFGTPDSREMAMAIAGGLLVEGWGVQGAELGGELVMKGAPADNEVRYFKPEDAPAAMALANALSLLAGGQIVHVRDFSALYPLAPARQLEVWLGTAPTMSDGSL